MESISLKPVIADLETIFGQFNRHFFNGELIQPVITISPDTTKGAYGWCTGGKVWKNGQEGHYEINICADHLDRALEEVAGTMLHEMVHLHNIYTGVKDTSRGGTYHNGKFRDTAQAHGLIVEKFDKYGWSTTKLNPEALEVLKDLGLEKFSLVRDGEPKEAEKKTSKTSSLKYVCPQCGCIIRATKKVRVICGECEVPFELV